MELRKPIEIKKIEPMGKEGALMDMFVWLIIIFVVTIFFALWVFGFGQITDSLTSIDTSVGTNNETIGSIADRSLGTIDRFQTGGLELLAVGMIIFFGFSIVISNFLVKANPAFLIVYLFIIITAVIFSVYLSNAFEDIMSKAPLDVTLTEMRASSFLMLNLPIITTIIGFISMIFLFAGIMIDREAGGSVI